jgi:hypothetical protein
MAVEDNLSKVVGEPIEQHIAEREREREREKERDYEYPSSEHAKQRYSQ